MARGKKADDQIPEIVDEDPIGANGDVAGDADAGDDVEEAGEEEAVDLPEDDENDPVAAQERALKRLEEAIDRMELSGGSLVVDMRDTMLEVVKRMPKVWSACSQHERRDFAKMIESCAQRILKEVSFVIAASDRPSIRATMGNITVGDKVEAKIKVNSLPEDEMAACIAGMYHLKGKTVIVISADDQAFYHTKREAVEPDEPGLPFVGDADSPRQDGNDDTDADADQGADADTDADQEGEEDDEEATGAGEGNAGTED